VGIEYCVLTKKKSWTGNGECGGYFDPSPQILVALLPILRHADVPQKFERDAIAKML